MLLKHLSLEEEHLFSRFHFLRDSAAVVLAGNDKAPFASPSGPRREDKAIKMSFMEI